MVATGSRLKPGPGCFPFRKRGERRRTTKPNLLVSPGKTRYKEATEISVGRGLRRRSMSGAAQPVAREVMDIRQASEYLGISGDSLYRYASEGFIPAFKFGNRWRFKKSLLDAWMDEKSGVQKLPPIAVMPRQKKPVARSR